MSVPDRFINRLLPLAEHRRPQRTTGSTAKSTCSAKSTYKEHLSGILSATEKELELCTLSTRLQRRIGPQLREVLLPQSPIMTLDAPGLRADGSVLDWSANNVLAVALSQSVYLLPSPETGSASRPSGRTPEYRTFLPDPAHNITTTAWMTSTAGQQQLAVGLSSGQLQVWDAETLTCVRVMDSPSDGSVTKSLSWYAPSSVLSTGDNAGSILHHDVRAPRHVVGVLRGPTQEICALKWSRSGVLASGSVDQLLHIWDARHIASQDCICDTALHRINAHRDAVTALAWCPWQRNLLASGGHDQSIRFWNAKSGACVDEVDTGDRVSALQWSLHEKHLVSAGGYAPSRRAGLRNEQSTSDRGAEDGTSRIRGDIGAVTLWRYPNMTRRSVITGYSEPVRHMSLSSNGTTLVTGCTDEYLRFLRISEGAEGTAAVSQLSLSGKEAMARASVR